MTEWQNGIRAFHEGRLREAADRLRAATAEQERTTSQAVSHQTYAYLGAALYALGNASGAVDAFSSALALAEHSPAPLELQLNLANSLMATGQRHKARQRLVETLQAYPGAIEARMLLERLDSRGETEPLTGFVLGESPDGVKRYLETLSFGSVQNGFAPDQVRIALDQIKRYINTLADQQVTRDEAISQYAAEIERLRQSEETLIENLMQSRADVEHWRRRAESQDDEILGGPDNSPKSPQLTPLEKLLQKKQ